MEVSNLSFENVEGYQQTWLLLSKSHFFNKQAVQQQSHQRKELAKFTVPEIHFWETPQGSFHEVCGVHGELKVKALNPCSITAKLLCIRLCFSMPTFQPLAPQHSIGHRTGLRQTPWTSNTRQALCSHGSTQINV